MANLLLGAPVAAALNEKSKSNVTLLGKIGVTPTLAILRVGEREDDLAYQRGATKRCEAVGVAVKSVPLPENITQKMLLDEIKALNSDGSVHGILLFMPLPKHLNGEEVRGAISPHKDVDGIGYGSLAGVFSGVPLGFSPCTAQACMEILSFYGVDCTGKRAVVLGRSLVVGKPAAMLLMARNATVTVCHTKTLDLASITKSADIIIAAVGKAGAMGAELAGRGQILIDVGINFHQGKMCGDADFDALEPLVAAITPVPGGVGTVTTSVLVNHVVEAAMRQSMHHVRTVTYFLPE